MADWMLDPPEEDEEIFEDDFDGEVDDNYDVDEESANASSKWQDSRGF